MKALILNYPFSLPKTLLDSMFKEMLILTSVKALTRLLLKFEYLVVQELTWTQISSICDGGKMLKLSNTNTCIHREYIPKLTTLFRQGEVHL